MSTRLRLTFAAEEQIATIVAMHTKHFLMLTLQELKFVMSTYLPKSFTRG